MRMLLGVLEHHSLSKSRLHHFRSALSAYITGWQLILACQVSYPPTHTILGGTISIKKPSTPFKEPRPNIIMLCHLNNVDAIRSYHVALIIMPLCRVGISVSVNTQATVVPFAQATFSLTHPYGPVPPKWATALQATSAEAASAFSALKAGQPPLADRTICANCCSETTSRPSSGDPSALLSDRCLRPP